MSAANKKRNLLVTSALPYANGSIHIGHMVEHIQTDIFVRFQRLIGNTCHYMCADDAHGTAIMLSAEKKGLSPEEFIEDVQREHVRDFQGFSIQHDHYYSTHSEENRVLSEDIYNKAKEAGVIAEKEVEQYFCESSGLFLSDRYIKGECPKCGAPDQYGDACEKCYATYSATQLGNPISVLSGKAPVLKKSLHYFFQLSKFESQIKEWLSQDHVTDPVRNKLQEWFDAGLKDWDISRDAPYFGFKIPGSDNKYFYVWVDAPVGYIATTKHWCGQHQTEDWEKIWKSGEFEIHHFIGKDILYFHTLFWPAMLHVGEYVLPKRVNVHGFLTVNGEKMSKSRGTFILASTYLEHLNPEFLRYYYAAKLSSGMDDLDLNLEDFMHKINSDVLGKVVNIASRLGAVLHKRCGGQLTSIPEEGEAMLTQIQNKSDVIAGLYEQLEFHKAMREIMQAADIANHYIDAMAPWTVAKESPEEAAAICTAGLNACRLITIYLKPVLPTIASGIEAFLKISPLTWLDLDTRLTYSKIEPYTHLASRLTQDDVDKLIVNEE